jgi:hypothetical protein
MRARSRAVIAEAPSASMSRPAGGWLVLTVILGLARACLARTNFGTWPRREWPYRKFRAGPLFS